MQASSEAATLLVVADRDDAVDTTASQFGFDEREVSLLTATTETASETLSTATVDCVLIDPGADAHSFELVTAIRELAPVTPVILFTEHTEDETLNALLNGNGVEIIPSTLQETPAPLIRDRVESVLTETSLTGATVGAGTTERDQLLATIMENVGDVVWMLDATNEQLTFVNEAFERIWGRSREELYAQPGTVLKGVHPDDSDRVREALDSLFETPDSYEITYRVVQPDGKTRWVHDRAFGVYEDGRLRRVVGLAQDITEHKRREEQMESQRDELAELDRINRIIRDVDSALLGAQTRTAIEQAVCDRLATSNQYHFAVALRADSDGNLEPSTWTEAGEEYVRRAFSVETEQHGPGMRASETGEIHIVPSIEDGKQPWRDIAVDIGIEGFAAIPVSYEGRNYGVIGVYTTETNAFGEREIEVLDELGERVGYAIAAVQRREREQTLTALYEATQELLAAETEQAVCDVVVDTTAHVLDPSGIGVFIFEDQANELRPMAATDELRVFYKDTMTFGPGHPDSEAWQVYATGESRYFADIRTADHVTNPDTDARSTLMIPLGEHGVFVVASRTKDVFDEQKRQLVGLLAATTEAALDRVSGREDIKERDQQLAKRTSRLIRLEEALQFLRETERLLRTANTRSEIEDGVCKRLVDIDDHRFAWIATIPPDEAELLPQSYAGDGNSYIDTVSLAVDGEEPAAVAARTGQIVTIEDVTDHLHDTDWAHRAADRTFQSVLAVPLVYGQTTYGVLAVYSDEPNSFRDGFETMLADLGQTIAFGINTVETRRAILADCVTELEIDISEAGGFPNAVADIADGTVTFREIQPTTDGGTRLLFELTDPPVEEILALESEFVSVESLSHTASGETHLFRATLSGETVATTLFGCGGIPREVVATATETRAVVQLPQELDVRVFLGRLETHYTTAELLSRTKVKAQPNSHEQAWAVLEEELTERQREVLLTAYRSGYFQSPRETTGAELAALFDLSQPTVTYHLREAQRRLFESLFADHS